jgi:hypothetical protein
VTGPQFDAGVRHDGDLIATLQHTGGLDRRENPSGAFMAHELSRDFSIAVIDRRGPIRGSTLASTAMLQWELDLPLIALADQIGTPAPTITTSTPTADVRA